MGYMKFTDDTAESLFRKFKWARNNTIQMFEKTDESKILSNIPPGSENFIFQPIIFQFQCIVTTTDTVIRKMMNNKNKSYGVLIRGEKIIKKEDIENAVIKELLDEQLSMLQEIFKRYAKEQAKEGIEIITDIMNHEYLHQGQLILQMREAGVDLPDRFKKAFAL